MDSDTVVGAYLGVDGGNSGTRALLIDGHGVVLGRGEGSNANHQGIGYPAAVNHVMAAVHQAMDSAGKDLAEVTAAHFALAGDDVAADHARLHELLQPPLGSVHFRLTNDVWAGLRVGSLDGSGVAVNCGSGCGAVGRSPNGQEIVIADLGYIFGDSGGGVQIGVDAVRAVVRAWDGRGSRTGLTASVLAHTGMESTEALYVALHQDRIGTDLIRGCTRLVFQAAARGDNVARAILQRIGDELGVSAVAIAQRLEMTACSFPFVLTGGAFRTLDSALARAAIDRLQSVAPRCLPALPCLMPVAGAALLAMDTAGALVTPRHFTVLQELGLGWHPEER